MPGGNSGGGVGDGDGGGLGGGPGGMAGRGDGGGSGEGEGGGGDGNGGKGGQGGKGGGAGGSGRAGGSCSVLCMIQSRKVLTRAYEPGRLGSAQPGPHDTTAMSIWHSHAMRM